MQLNDRGIMFCYNGDGKGKETTFGMSGEFGILPVQKQNGGSNEKMSLPMCIIRQPAALRLQQYGGYHK